MKKLENLAIGDIVELEFKEGNGEFKEGNGKFKDNPTVVGYVHKLPTSNYVELGSENPLLPKERFQFTNGTTHYPINNIYDLTVLKKVS